MAKLVVSIGDANFRLLSSEARERGISMQELIRAIIVPDWVRIVNHQKVQPESPRVESVPFVEPQREIQSIFTRSRR